MTKKNIVLLPVYGGDKPHYLKESLNSIYNQTFSSFHVYILVDGEITVELQACLDDINDPRFECLYFSTNRGLAFVLNDGIAKGIKNNATYFIRMDADDICKENRFQEQIEFMNNHPKVGVCGAFIEEIDENSQ